MLALAPGCGAVLDLLGLSGETGSAELKRFTSEVELRDFFADQVSRRNGQFADFDRVAVFDEGANQALDTAGSDPASSAPTAGEGDGTSSGDFSQTTLQEAGVDEADVVKTDGTHLYIIRGGVLQIVDVSDPSRLALVGEVALEGFGRELFLREGKVVALTQTGGGFFHVGGGLILDSRPPAMGGMMSGSVDMIAIAAPEEPVFTTDPDAPADVGLSSDVDFDRMDEPEFRFERPRSIVTIVDVSVPDAPVIVSTTRFEGTQSASRMIDGVLHLTLATFQHHFFDAMPHLGRPGMEVTSIDVEEFLPNFSRTNADGAERHGMVVSWQDLYHPTDADGFGIVTLVSLDVDDNAAFSAVGVVAEPGMIYSSREALYLTDTEFNFLGSTRETTDIYKFTYAGRGADATAAGTVPGRILNQYSMGEHHGFLRVATTVGPTFSTLGQRNGPFNNIYVLGQVGDALEMMGSVENIAPGETVQSARFVGDRGYLVTFERIDPLFTLDLSDATDPRVIGELKVPGFSTYIVPMDENHLLTVGQHVPVGGPVFPRGVQLSIFDISDFAHPTLSANVILGEGAGASSEATFNPKAFTFFAERGLIALPLSIAADFFFFDDVFMGGDGMAVDGVSTDASEPAVLPPDAAIDAVVPSFPGFDGLVVFSVSVEDGFTELGRISTRFEESGYFWSSFTRGVFIGDDVFAVTDHGIRGAPISDPASVPYELLLEDPVATAPR